MALQTTAYCPIFDTEGEEWMFTAGIRLLADDVITYAKKVQQDAPGWSAGNKFVRIAKVQITEIFKDN